MFRMRFAIMVLAQMGCLQLHAANPNLTQEKCPWLISEVTPEVSAVNRLAQKPKYITIAYYGDHYPTLKFYAYATPYTQKGKRVQNKKIQTLKKVTNSFQDLFVFNAKARTWVVNLVASENKIAWLEKLKANIKPTRVLKPEVERGGTDFAGPIPSQITLSRSQRSDLLAPVCQIVLR